MVTLSYWYLTHRQPLWVDNFTTSEYIKFLLVKLTTALQTEPYQTSSSTEDKREGISATGERGTPAKGRCERIDQSPPSSSSWAASWSVLWRASVYRRTCYRWCSKCPRLCSIWHFSSPAEACPSAIAYWPDLVMSPRKREWGRALKQRW